MNDEFSFLVGGGNCSINDEDDEAFMANIICGRLNELGWRF